MDPPSIRCIFQSTVASVKIPVPLQNYSNFFFLLMDNGYTIYMHIFVKNIYVKLTLLIRF